MKTLALALTLAAAPAFAQQPMQPAPAKVIVTSGEGVVKRAPDRAFVTIAAQSRSRTPAEAQRLNNDVMNAVLDKLKAAGIPAEAIQTVGYSLQPEFDYGNGKQTLRDYLANNQVQVRVDAMAKLGEILGLAVGTGATNVSGVRFDLKDRDAAEAEALRLAVRDARRRADAAAAGAGVEIAGVVRIDDQRQPDMGRPMPMARMGTMAESVTVQSAPFVPLESGEIEIHSTVTLTVAIR
jgi:uncharacterized protein YggE